MIERCPESATRGGFVLALVVLMLFAISVAGATGYLVVASEFTMSRGASEGAEALAVARAGLQRFVAEQLGVVGDSVSYAIGDGVALITTRKLSEQDSINDLYYIRSEGTVTNILQPNTPATRVVGGYAWHRRRPLSHHAALMISANRINVLGDVIGIDSATVLDCAGGGTAGITAAIATSQVQAWSFWGGTLNGNPDKETWPGGYAQMYDSVDLRWDVLSDPNFPVEFEDSPPNFASLPADSFPVVRYNGDLWAGSSWAGRGVLIVTGRLGTNSAFQWDGIVLAGSVANQWGEVQGMMVGGLDGTNPQSTVWWVGGAYYNSCNVYAANESLSYLELLENTVFEVN